MSPENFRRMAPKLASLALAAAVIAIPAVTIPADASSLRSVPAVTTLNVTYDVNGSSTVAKTGSIVKIGPTTLATALSPDGTFSGALAVPPATTSFTALGFIPVSATASFLPRGAATGALKTVGGVTTVSATAKYILRLSNVTVFGLPTFVGNTCQTVSALKIGLATPTGSAFNIFTGGTVAGTYTIPNFGNCGLLTGLLNGLVPGPGNTISLALSNGRATG